MISTLIVCLTVFAIAERYRPLLAHAIGDVVSPTAVEAVDAGSPPVGFHVPEEVDTNIPGDLIILAKEYGDEWAVDSVIGRAKELYGVTKDWDAVRQILTLEMATHGG